MSALLRLVAIALVLAGCVSMPTQDVAVSTKTVESKVPVPVACLDSKDVPMRPLPTPVDTEHATHDQIAAAAAADLLAQDAYIELMAATLLRCTKGTSP